jgi:hypothetical protein
MLAVVSKSSASHPDARVGLRRVPKSVPRVAKGSEVDGFSWWCGLVRSGR